jgi:hypothetical protein
MKWADEVEDAIVAEAGRKSNTMPTRDTHKVHNDPVSTWKTFTSKTKTKPPTKASDVKGTNGTPLSGFPSLVDVKAQEKRVTELEVELLKKDGYIADLVAQVDEKDRRVASLEAQVTSQQRRIAALEDTNEKLLAKLEEAPKTSSDTSESTLSTESIDSTAKPVEVGITEFKKYTQILTSQAHRKQPEDSNVATKAEPTEEPENNAQTGLHADNHVQNAGETIAKKFVDGPQDTQSVAEPLEDDRTGEQNAVNKESPAVKTTQLETPGAKSAWGSQDGSPKSPKSPTTTGPAVPPAPKLSFPLQKVSTRERAKQTADWVSQPVNNTSNIGGWSKGHPERDIRDMTLQERSALFNGPSVNVMVGKENLRGFSKHMLMAVSPRIREYFLKNPKETYIAFPAGAVAVPVMQILRDYLRAMGTQKTVFSIKLRFNWQQDLAIRRDCCYLGMGMYVAHFTRQYCDKVREGFVGLDNIALIEKNTADDDALFKCLANNLANMRRRGTLPDAEAFEEFLKKHPRLSQAIGSIDAAITANRGRRQGQQATDRALSVSGRTGHNDLGTTTGNATGPGRLSPPEPSNLYAARAAAKLAR